MAGYLASGMSQMPESFNGETPFWGPNLVAAIQVALGDGEPKGSLPVDVPELIDDGEGFSFGSDVLFARGTGLSY